MEKQLFNEVMGHCIKAARTSKGMSQEDLASLMGINFQNISSYERGQVSPTLFWITRMCDALQIDSKEFIIGFFDRVAVHNVTKKPGPFN